MKALSLARPWAALILRHGKPIENRTWPTNYRGPLLIHAAKSWDDEAGELARELRVDGLCDAPDHHPVGIVGIVDLVGFCTAAIRERPAPCTCGPWAMHGQYHWRLANPRPLNTPVPCRGALGLWTPGPSVLDAVLEQLSCELCHSDPGLSVWRGSWLCEECQRAAEYQDGLTPEERCRDEEAIAMYVAESATWGGDRV